MLRAYVTEEIWNVLPGERPTLMTCAFPEVNESWLDDSCEKDLELLMGIISGIRNIRAESDVHPSAAIDAYLVCGDTDKADFITSYSDAIKDMTRLASFTVGDSLEKPDDAATYILDDIEIFVPLQGLVDVDAEREKLARERSKVEAKLKQVNGKLNNDKFINNAPAAIVAKEREKKAQLAGKLEKIAEAEARLKNISA